ncbi:MAG: DUF5107 domain-containing protein [Terriglobia bacterium]
MSIWRPRTFALAACCAALAIAMVPQFARSEVRAWRGSIEIPTYLLGPADPDPTFPVVSRREIYPYRMLDDLTGERASKSYRAIYLENPYLKLTILPDLGGRLYSAYDKVDGREVFYRNNVVKYGLIGVRGAWISGGVEFNFPNAHTVSTVSPVESVLLHNPGGSVTAVVGAMDRVSNMHWEVAITLRPDAARVEQHVLLFNSTPLEHVYWFWANAAVKATDDLQFIYPMREVLPDSPFAAVETWPVWRGVDESWYRNLRHATAIFGRQVQRNFFGVYYHQSDYGVVHVADYRKDPGKKLWSWGTAGDGLIWTHLLTDHDGPYNEIQSGRFATQVYREFMKPRRVEEWTEYWYPVRGLKGRFVEATSDMAINIVPSVAQGSPQVSVLVSPAVNIRGAKIEVTLGDKRLREIAPVNLEALKPARFMVAGPGALQAKKELAVKIESAGGKTILNWSAAEPIDGDPDFVPEAGVKPRQIEITSTTPVEQLYLHGVFFEKRGNPAAAEAAYQLALARDPGYIPALLAEARRSYAAADFRGAASFVTRALARDGSDPNVHYTAGVIFRAGGQLTLAEDAFWAAIHFGGPPAPSLVALGEIALVQKKDERASALLGRALTYNPLDALARADLAVALRLQGRTRAAAETAERAVAQMPLLPQALAEERIDEGEAAAGNATAATSGAGAQGIDADDYLAVAAWYHRLGDFAASDTVLHRAADAVQGAPAQRASPIVYYYLASNERHEGHLQQAENDAKRAAALPGDEIFPNRLTDAQVLAEAIAQTPSDAHAQYALGNFLFAHGRYDDAWKLWFQALSEGFESPVLMRNLGVYEWKVKADLPAAAGYYERAIHLGPNNFRLYTDLDEIYTAMSDFRRRARLFHTAPPAVLARDTVRARRALFLITEGHFDAALSLLQTHEFKPWEGGAEVHQIFVAANIEKGRAALAARQPKLAESAFREAFEYPENLGVGKPDAPRDAEQSYWLGTALEEEGLASQARVAWKASAAHADEGQSASAVFAALALRRLGKTAQASEILDRLEQPSRPLTGGGYAEYAVGLAEFYSGRADRARRSFEQCLKTDPQLWQARVALDDMNRYPASL